MKLNIALILLALCTGCGTRSTVVEVRTHQVFLIKADRLRHATPAETKFVATGFSSGLMLQLDASRPSIRPPHIGVDMWRYPLDTVLIQESARRSQSTRGDNAFQLEIRNETVSLTSVINDLGQAFFKIPPGTYLVRPKLATLNFDYAVGIEVKAGKYSIVPLPPADSLANSSGR